MTGATGFPVDTGYRRAPAVAAIGLLQANLNFVTVAASGVESAGTGAWNTPSFGADLLLGAGLFDPLEAAIGSCSAGFEIGPRAAGLAFQAGVIAGKNAASTAALLPVGQGRAALHR